MASIVGRGLDGRRVAVIGGGSGIGSAVAAAALENGASVVIGTRRSDTLDAALSRLDGATGAMIDVRDESSVQSFFLEAATFDHVVVTAGDWETMAPASAEQIDLPSARSAFDVRFWGALTVAKHGASRINRGGSLTLTSGTLTRRPQKGFPLASAVGGAVEALVVALAVDLPLIRVNAVSPGLTLTDVVRSMPSEYLDAAVAHLPIARPADPAEAAHAYLYCMLNTYVTGQILTVDGGDSVA